MPLTADETLAYQQGSTACQNYSRLTMSVRTLSQQILAASAFGLVATLSPLIKDESNKTDLLFFGGLAIGVFAVSLWLVDWHYQSAFTAIRNSLARLEIRAQVKGPWRAHLKARSRIRDHCASYIPFLLLWMMGCFTFIYSEARSIPISASTAYYAAGVAALLLGIIGFSVLLVNAAKKDRADLVAMEREERELLNSK